MVGAAKPLKASGFPILGVKSGKEITRTSGGSTTGEPWKSMWSFFISVKNQNLETKIIANIWKLGYTVKPLRHLQFLKKLSAIRRCPLQRVLDFFEQKVITDKNLTIFYLICDNLQLHFLKHIWIVLCLIFCNLIVFNFAIITFVCLSICFRLHKFQQNTSQHTDYKGLQMPSFF